MAVTTIVGSPAVVDAYSNYSPAAVPLSSTGVYEIYVSAGSSDSSTRGILVLVSESNDNANWSDFKAIGDEKSTFEVLEGTNAEISYKSTAPFLKFDVYNADALPIWVTATVYTP